MDPFCQKWLAIIILPIARDLEINIQNVLLLGKARNKPNNAIPKISNRETTKCNETLIFKKALTCPHFDKNNQKASRY